MKTVRAIAAAAFAAAAVQASAADAVVASAGDSITQGIGTPRAADGTFPQSYPAQLQEILGGCYSVTNFGAGGRTLLRKADPYGYGRPLKCGASIAVICLGTNDSKPYAWDAHGDEFEADLEKMVGEFKAQPSFERVLLCLPPPVFNGGQWGIREEVLASGVRPAIRRVAEKTGCELVDLATPLAGAAADFPDRVHPNASAARRIAQAVADAIRPPPAPCGDEATAPCGGAGAEPAPQS